MLDSITLTLPVNTLDDNIDNYPTHLTVTITEQLRQWIIKMSQLVKKNDLDYVAKVDWTPEYFKKDDPSDEDEPLSEYDGGTEGDRLIVRENDFFWAGVIKHTNVHIEGEITSIKDLNKYFRYFTKPLELMPKYLNDKDEVIRTIAKQRMEKGE